MDIGSKLYSHRHINRVDTLETHSPIQYHASHLGHGLLNIFKGMLITLQLPV